MGKRKGYMNMNVKSKPLVLKHNRIYGKNITLHRHRSSAVDKGLISSISSGEVSKWRFIAAALALCFVLHTVSAGSVIPDTADGWRVEVGPAGNDFYDSSAPQKKARLSYKDNVPKPPRDEREFKKLLKENLGPYRERFNFENQISKLGKGPTKSDGSFRYVVMGDNRSQPKLWSSIVKHIDRLVPKPAFVIHVGDIVEKGYAQQYRDYYIPAVLATDIPFFVAIGNHDDSTDSKAREYRYLFGEKALNYYFDYGKARFIFTDNVTNVQKYKDTLKWLDKTLIGTPDGYRKYVAAHKPPKNIKKWSYHALGTQESKDFTDLMGKHNVSEVYIGHIHAYSTARYNGINYTVSGGGGATLHGRFGPLGSVHHYVICDFMANGTVRQQVVRFYDTNK
jgi:predicted phosphodiesterase